MSIININHSKCVMCERCISACPILIFKHNITYEQIEIINFDQCVKCGHCITVCPEDAIEHSDLSYQDKIKINYDTIINDNQLMNLLLSRRSIKTFTKQPIPDALLDKIITAANQAPTANNNRELYYTLITNKEKLESITKIVINVFNNVARKIDQPIIKQITSFINPNAVKYIDTFRHMNDIYTKQKKDPILKGATALLLIHTPKNDRFGCNSANLAYQNASLMAQVLNIGHFYAGSVCTAAQVDDNNQIAELFGIEGIIHAGLAMGMPKFNYPNLIFRNDVKLKRF